MSISSRIHRNRLKVLSKLNMHSVSSGDSKNILDKYIPKAETCNDMYISILIPTFRRAESLRRLLQILCTQIKAANLSDIVNIIVIDNCPDASARGVVCDDFSEHIRYVHEPRPGVSHARNRGVLESDSTYVVFIDDDETPEPAWLEAFYGQALKGVDSCFGPVHAALEIDPGPRLRPLLEKMFTRELGRSTGADITDLRAYLGTGNSMFKRSTAFKSREPFEPIFNHVGGEDMWFLRQIVEEQGLRLIWCREAVVREHVPADRTSFGYARARKFRDGQIRCLVERHSHRRGMLKVAVWMAVGLAQTAAFGLGAALVSFWDRERAEVLRVRCAGGLGKLLWWRDASRAVVRP